MKNTKNIFKSLITFSLFVNGCTSYVLDTVTVETANISNLQNYWLCPKSILNHKYWGSDDIYTSSTHIRDWTITDYHNPQITFNQSPIRDLCIPGVYEKFTKRDTRDVYFENVPSDFKYFVQLPAVTQQFINAGTSYNNEIVVYLGRTALITSKMTDNHFVEINKDSLNTQK